MNMVWTYDIHRETQRPSRVEETGARTNFYSIRTETGEYDDSIDEWLQGVENAATAPYERLLAGEIPSGQEKADFSVFVSSLYCRSPALIRASAEGYAKFLEYSLDRMVETRERFDEIIDSYEESTGTSAGDRDELWEFNQDKSRYSIEIGIKRGLSVLKVSDELQGILFDRHWYLFDAAEDFFITSDHPVCRWAPVESRHPFLGDGGFKNPFCEVTLPLSPSLALLITARAGAASRVTVPAHEVWHFNHLRAHFAEDFLYADRNDGRVTQLGREHKDHKIGYTIEGSPKGAEVKVTR